MPQLFPTSSFTLITKGIHPAICCEFVDLGIVETKWGKKHKGMWVFQVAETEEDGRRKEARCKFNLTVGSTKKPSKVQKLMGKWRGQSYSEAELKNGDVDPEKPVGVACLLDIEHITVEDGTTIHFVDNVLPPGEIRLQPEGYVPVAQRSEGGDHGPDDDEGPGSPGSAPAPPPPPPPTTIPPSQPIAGAQADRPPF